MNVESETVLLVENDKQIVGDVKFASSMLKVNLGVVASAVEAESFLAKETPLLVLLRVSIEESKSLYSSLLRLYTPTVLLFTTAEEESQGIDSDPPVIGTIRLPIQFPAFTNELRELVSRSLMLRRQAKRTSEAPGLKEELK